LASLELVCPLPDALLGLLLGIVPPGDGGVLGWAGAGAVALGVLDPGAGVLPEPEVWAPTTQATTKVAPKTVANIDHRCVMGISLICEMRTHA
jgi:hypothetical protein